MHGAVGVQHRRTFEESIALTPVERDYSKRNLLIACSSTIKVRAKLYTDSIKLYSLYIKSGGVLKHSFLWEK